MCTSYENQTSTLTTENIMGDQQHEFLITSEIGFYHYKFSQLLGLNSKLSDQYDAN